MKPTTALLAAAATTGLTLASSSSTSTTFTITSFSFSGTPHSVLAQYALTVTDSDGASTTCHTTTNTSPSIAFFDTTACENSDWTFRWYDNGVGTSVVQITHKGAAADGFDVVGWKKFEAGSVKVREGEGPNGSVQYLSTEDGSAGWVVEAEEVRSPA